MWLRNSACFDQQLYFVKQAFSVSCLLAICVPKRSKTCGSLGDQLWHVGVVLVVAVFALVVVIVGVAAGGGGSGGGGRGGSAVGVLDVVVVVVVVAAVVVDVAGAGCVFDIA